MARKYLDRKERKFSEKKTESSSQDDELVKTCSKMENPDPFKAEDRTVIFRNKQRINNDKLPENSKDQLKKIDRYVKSINSHISDRLLRIEKIKKSYENFEREIELLQGGKNRKSQDKKIDEVVEQLTGDTAAVKASKELSALIEKYAIEKLEMIKKMFDNEKKQSRELNEKLQENLSKVAIAEERLKHQRDQLALEVRDKAKKLIHAERLSAIGELSARLAHDLRNPLTVIKGTIEIVKNKSDTQNQTITSKQLEMMERAVSRMSHQIDDVLDFVKIQTLRTSRNTLLETLSLSATKIKNSEKLIIRLPENDVEFVYDVDKLEVVFDNLFSNAVEAMKGEGQIKINVYDFENEVVIDVEDSGEGIPDDILPKIFEPLFTTKQRGTGLGLASCKSIIDQHGGTISVRNKPSVFTIKLPKMQEISTI